MKRNHSPPPPTHWNLVINVFWTSLQVHLRGDGVLLEMVGGSVRGYAEHRKRPRGIWATGVHRRRLEHERRGSFKLLVHCRPIHLGSKVNNNRDRFLLRRSSVSSSSTRLFIIIIIWKPYVEPIPSNLLSASTKVIGYGYRILNCNHRVWWPFVVRNEKIWQMTFVGILVRRLFIYLRTIT